MSEQPWRPRVIDVLALLGFFTLWLVPMAQVGYRGGAPASWPINVRDLYSVSCLFGQASERVSMFYVQVRRANHRGWEDLDEREYFKLEPFGHRTRFDRFMSRFGYQADSDLARRELGEWLAAADRAGDPTRAPIIAVRFVWTDRIIDAEHPPDGRWRKPPRAEAGTFRQLGEIVWVSDGPSSRERTP